MNKFFAIAHYTLKEEIRRRTFLILLVFPPLCIYVSTIFTSLTPGYEKAFITDIALSSISFFMMLMAAFITSDMFIKEEQQGTFYLFLTNPVRRLTLIAGKFVGGLAFLVAGTVLMGFFTWGVIYIKFHQWDFNFMKAIFLLLGQWVVLMGYGILGATMLSKYTNISMVFLVYVGGHLTSYFEYFEEHLKEVSAVAFLRWLFKSVPDLGRFEARDLVVLGINLEWPHILSSCLYAVSFAVVLAILSSLLLRGRYIQ